MTGSIQIHSKIVANLSQHFKKNVAGKSTKLFFAMPRYKNYFKRYLIPVNRF
jgi:hypothetical protein